MEITLLAPLGLLRMLVPAAPRRRGVRLAHGFAVVEIALTLGEQEHMLMRLGRPVFHALRLGIGLYADIIGAQPPSIVTKSDGEPRRNEAQILVLVPGADG